MSEIALAPTRVDGRNGDRPYGDLLLSKAAATGPALLFGVRLWASVCLALYVAFWLELDTPSWAGTTATP